MNSPLTLEKIKNTPVALSLVVAVAWMLWIGYGWFSGYHAAFITKAQAAQEIKKQISGVEAQVSALEDKVDDNTTLLRNHIKEFRIKNALDRIEHLDTKIYWAKRDQTERGETPASREQLASLVTGRDRASKYLDCLLNERPNCEHLETRSR